MAPVTTSINNNQPPSTAGQRDIESVDQDRQVFIRNFMSRIITLESDCPTGRTYENNDDGILILADDLMQVSQGINLMKIKLKNEYQLAAVNFLLTRQPLTIPDMFELIDIARPDKTYFRMVFSRLESRIAKVIPGSIVKSTDVLDSYRLADGIQISDKREGAEQPTDLSFLYQYLARQHQPAPVNPCPTKDRLNGRQKDSLDTYSMPQPINYNNGDHTNLTSLRTNQDSRRQQEQNQRSTNVKQTITHRTGSKLQDGVNSTSRQPTNSVLNHHGSTKPSADKQVNALEDEEVLAIMRYEGATELLVKLDTQKIFTHPDAACRGVDASIFFPEKGGRRITKTALKFCANCLVRQQCADFALDNHEKYGIWGGLTVTDRKKLFSERRRKRQADTAINNQTDQQSIAQ